MKYYIKYEDGYVEEIIWDSYDVDEEFYNDNWVCTTSDVEEAKSFASYYDAKQYIRDIYENVDYVDMRDLSVVEGKE